MKNLWIKKCATQICLKLAGMAVLVVLQEKKEAKSQHVQEIKKKTMTAGFIFLGGKKKKKSTKEYKVDRFITETKGTGRQPSCADTAGKKP